MEADDHRKALPRGQKLAFIATSMSAIGDKLTDLVDRMEAEVAERGTIDIASAAELRSLRVNAERLFADTEVNLVRDH
jgi:hypothetical protein